MYNSYNLLQRRVDKYVSRKIVRYFLFTVSTLLYSSSSKLIVDDWSKNVYEECWRIPGFSQ